MSCVSHCISYIMNADIPDLILEDAFVDSRQRRRRQSRSLESNIRELIFEKRIIRDLSKIRGVELTLNLAGVPYEKLANFNRIYNVPMSLTSGRIIVSAQLTTLNVTSNYAEHVPGQSHQSFQMSPVMNSAQSVVASNKPIPNIGNAEVEILNDNVIMINDYQNYTSDVTLVAKLEYSRDLSEIRPSYYRDIADISLLATKAYIYRNLSLTLDKTKLDAGRDFGRYKEFVDEYRDANEQYVTLLDEKMHRVLILNDQAQKQRHIMKAGKIRV